MSDENNKDNKVLNGEDNQTSPSLELQGEKTEENEEIKLELNNEIPVNSEVSVESEKSEEPNSENSPSSEVIQEDIPDTNDEKKSLIISGPTELSTTDNGKDKTKKSNKPKMEKGMVKKIAESAILLAIAFILSMLKMKIIPQGGSITIASMLPLIIIGMRYGAGWGGLCGVVYGLLQIIEGGLYTPPVGGAGYFILTILLDYALAFGIIGFIAGLFKNSKYSSSKTVIIVVFSLLGRFICNFISGAIIWGSAAPVGQSAWIYSMVQNLGVIVPEMIITSVVAILLFAVPPIRNKVFSKFADKTNKEK